MATVKHELLFSDLEMGTDELGYINRKRMLGENDDDLDCADNEDLRYQAFLLKKGITARVYGGFAWVEA